MKGANGMNPLRLTKPVTITGPNFWGLPAQITFSPTSRPGWWWQVDPINQIFISPHFTDRKTLRTRLVFRNHKVEVYEHIGVLRWFGLDNVIIQSTPWPPYSGNALDMWDKLKPFCVEDTTKEITWHTVKDKIRWTYPKPRSGNIGFIEILPATEPEIEIEIVYSYKPLGIATIHRSLPSTSDLEEICQYPSQGVSWLHAILNITSRFGWPDRKIAIWPKGTDPGETLRRFALHRATDLLGDLSLLCNEHMFAGRIISHHSGHEADLHVIDQAFKILCPLTKP